MKPGPPRKPLAVLEKSASPRARGRKSDKLREITEVPGAPAMPKGMSKAAQVIWKDLVNILSEASILTRADGYALKMLCRLQAKYDALFKEVDKKGGFYQMKHSAMCETPQSKKLDVMEKQIWRMMTSFGLQPSGRVSLGAPIKHEPLNKSKLRFFKD